jgi:hypothetical protein
MPANLAMTLKMIEGIVYFNIIEHPTVQVWLEENVFGTMKTLQSILVG